MKKHRILDLPVAGPLILFLYAEFVVLIIGSLLYMCFSGSAFNIAAALLGIGMILVHRWWFRNEYRGGLYMDSLRDKRFWRTFLVIVVIDTAFCIHDIVSTPFVGITAAGVTSALLAGVLEEVENRYLLISVMMRRYKDRGNCLVVVLFTSLLFGLGHYINMNSAADFWPVTLQVLVTTASGFVMGAVFIRTGNIGVTMVWHFFHDFLCNLHGDSIVENPVLEGVSRGDLVECGLFVIADVIVGILLLKGQQENICKVWKNRWSEAEEETERSSLSENI